MADAVTATKKRYMNFKEIAAYSLGLFGFQAIVGLLNSYQAEFDGSILGANVSVVAILILVAKIVSAVADPVVGNLIDRFFMGYVTDMIHVLFVRFAVFNVAGQVQIYDPVLSGAAAGDDRCGVCESAVFRHRAVCVDLPHLLGLVHCHDHGRCTLAGNRFCADPGSHGAHQCGVHFQYL